MHLKTKENKTKRYILYFGFPISPRPKNLHSSIVVYSYVYVQYVLHEKHKTETTL